MVRSSRCLALSVGLIVLALVFGHFLAACSSGFASPTETVLACSSQLTCRGSINRDGTATPCLSCWEAPSSLAGKGRCCPTNTPVACVTADGTDYGCYPTLFDAPRGVACVVPAARVCQ